MVALPYALLDRLCDLGAALDEAGAIALAELLRHCPDATQAESAVRHGRMLLAGEALGMFDIAVDTWRFVAPATTGAEIGAALLAAAVQAQRLTSRPH